MTAITIAARLLRVAADELKNAHTLGGDWGNEHEALDAYNEHMATATTLEHMARQCLAQIEEPAGAAPAAVAPLPAVFEQIAQSWDGCMYDAPGETLDIGADIRAAAKRLLAEHAAAVVPQGEYPPLPDAAVWSVAGKDGMPTLGKGWMFSPVQQGNATLPLFTAWQMWAYHDLGRQSATVAAPALEAPAAPAVPAGFALVPIEPTQQMLDAGRWSGAGSVSIQEEWARKEVWSRMLATVTPPPAAYADDLVALVTELVQALRKATPDNDLAGHALDYLKRNGLQESPLRAADTAPQAPATEPVARAIFTNRNKPDVEWLVESVTRGMLLYAAPQAPAAPTPVAWPVARDVLQRWAQFADQAMRMQPRDMRNNMETLAEELTKLSAMAPMAAPAAPEDPMDWPLPCDVTVGHGTIRKGCKLRTLVLRMQVLYNLAQETELAAPAAPAVDALSQAARDVLAERQRQISAEGYEPEADQMYEAGELARAAATYALLATGDDGWRVEDNWPWGMSTLKRAEPRRMLEKAGALILADMERLDRAAAQAAAKGAGDA